MKNFKHLLFDHFVNLFFPSNFIWDFVPKWSSFGSKFPNIRIEIHFFVQLLWNKLHSDSNNFFLSQIRKSRLNLYVKDLSSYNYNHLWKLVAHIDYYQCFKTLSNQNQPVPNSYLAMAKNAIHSHKYTKYRSIYFPFP